MKIYKLFIILLIFSNNAIAEENDCSKINKLSKEYAKCITKIAKEKSKAVKEKVTSEENKNKLSNFKSKFLSKMKKFKNSKTGEEFIKNN